jgi:hypothetical protein
MNRAFAFLFVAVMVVAAAAALLFYRSSSSTLIKTPLKLLINGTINPTYLTFFSQQGGYVVVNDKTDDFDIYFPRNYTFLEAELRELIVGHRVTILGVDGCDHLCSKDLLWSHLVSAYGRDRAKHVMPETYLLSNPHDMQHLLTTQNDGVFILKKNVQRKEGLVLTRGQSLTKELLETYRTQRFKVVQVYVEDPFCIQGHKLNLRVYISVSSKGRRWRRADVYTDHIKCIYTLKKYKGKETLDFDSHITSHRRDPGLYERTGLPLCFNDLKIPLLREERESVLEQIRNIVSMVLGATKTRLGVLPNIRSNPKKQLFGCDFLLDSSLHVYLLEINKGPDMTCYSNQDRILKHAVLERFFSSKS